MVLFLLILSLILTPTQPNVFQGRITIVYNLDNCLECNRYIPQMVKQTLPRDLENYQISLITRKTRPKELDLLRRQLNLPGNTQLLPDNQKLKESSAGVSRSVSMCVSYMIACENHSVSSALKLIREVRPIADPNFGFMAQLEQFEKDAKKQKKVKKG